jgi:hypothetical protein
LLRYEKLETIITYVAPVDNTCNYVNYYKSMTKNANMIPCDKGEMIAKIQTKVDNLTDAVHELKDIKHQEHEDIKEMAQLKLTAMHGEMIAKNDAVLGEMKLYHEKQMAALHETITLQKITNSRVNHLEEKNVKIEGDINNIWKQGRILVWVNKHPKIAILVLLLLSAAFSYVAQFLSIETILKFTK